MNQAAPDNTPAFEIVPLSAGQLWELLKQYLELGLQMYKSVPLVLDESTEMGPLLRIQPYNIEIRWPLMANGQPAAELELWMQPQPDAEVDPEFVNEPHKVSMHNPQGPSGAMLEAAMTVASMITQMAFWAVLQSATEEAQMEAAGAADAEARLQAEEAAPRIVLAS